MIDQLSHDLDLLRRFRFGKSSKKLTGGQVALALEQMVSILARATATLAACVNAVENRILGRVSVVARHF